jgi:3-phenylpropionate/trans-cinnamate dioxygenase ferredoxin reductase subunit
VQRQYTAVCLDDDPDVAAVSVKAVIFVRLIGCDMDISIIGAGQAGVSLAGRLRTLKHEGPIALIGEEPVAPYQRPPLSKHYLLGDKNFDSLLLKPASFYEEQSIDLLTGQKVVGIDRANQRLEFADGQSRGYDLLALTTGSVARKLPAEVGGTLEGVYTLRSAQDVDEISASLFATGERPDGTQGRVLIVGGGYLGLEAAASARKRGLKVTLIEMSERILQRVAGAETSAFFRKLHQDHGVDLREGVGLDHLIGTDRVRGARLTDGSELDVDVVVVAIGVAADAELAVGAGLEVENGIVVDAQCRTSDPHIVAAGDCTSFLHGDGRIRLESVGNAIAQAEAAAATMLGGEDAYIAKPWFWSDQYDAKLQIAGLNTGYDRVVTRNGAGTTPSFWYFRGDTLLAVDAVNDGRAYMAGKKLIESGRTADPDAVADPDHDLKLLLRA